MAFSTKIRSIRKTRRAAGRSDAAPQPHEETMTMIERQSSTVAAGRVSANTDNHVRMQVCKAILREATKKVAEIGAGVLTEGIEEVELYEALYRASLDYFKAKKDRVYGATYVGITGPMEKVIEEAAATIAASEAASKDQDQAAA